MAGFYINFVIYISSSFELIRLYNGNAYAEAINQKLFSSSFELIRLYNLYYLLATVFQRWFSSSFELIRLYNPRLLEAL